jgi:peptidoglycan/xylan/chitin deacetylase (PgdA/CDA1 family)
VSTFALVSRAAGKIALSAALAGAPLACSEAPLPKAAAASTAPLPPAAVPPAPIPPPVHDAVAPSALSDLRFAGIETECNGVDDDGDGLVDVLLPVGPNACATSLRGACSRGFAACENGRRVCLTPAPTPEVFDGIDNDCNGIVDDVPDVAVRPRALVLMPSYAWSDAALDIATVVAALAQAGIPFDRQAQGSDWSSVLDSLDRYALAVVPGYLLGGVMSRAVNVKLERFVRGGGVVVVFKPLGTAADPDAVRFSGLVRSDRSNNVREVRFDGERPAAVTYIDSPEERTLPINNAGSTEPVEVYLLEPDARAGTEVVARAYGAGAVAMGPVVTRRPLGKGAVYALGHDFATFGASHCYVNCFEPSGDVLRLVLEGALREGAAGHVVLQHTAPSEASGVLMVTHDVDAPDAQNAGAWGDPGALQAAAIERAHGVAATFNITTDYVAGYYNPETIQKLCSFGMCPLGAHSVTHPHSFALLPEGTCHETRSTYKKTASLCGEIRVSRDLVAEISGRAPRVWRSPYLDINPKLFQELERNGFAYDSSFAVGDLPQNLPIDLANTGLHQDRFHHVAMLELAIACEDGLDVVENGRHRREELKEKNRARFMSLWRLALLGNIHNRAFTTVLLHPSRGLSAPIENVRVKMEALEGLLDDAASLDVTVRTLEEMGDFWRARLDAGLDAAFNTRTGYTGTLTVGATTAPGMTLEFGDVVARFSCPLCGEVRVRGKRVVIVNALPIGTRASFVASVR